MPKLLSFFLVLSELILILIIATPLHASNHVVTLQLVELDQDTSQAPDSATLEFEVKFSSYTPDGKIIEEKVKRFNRDGLLPDYAENIGQPKIPIYEEYPGQLPCKGPGLARTKTGPCIRGLTLKSSSPQNTTTVIKLSDFKVFLNGQLDPGNTQSILSVAAGKGNTDGSYSKSNGTEISPITYNYHPSITAYGAPNITVQPNTVLKENENAEIAVILSNPYPPKFTVRVEAPDETPGGGTKFETLKVDCTSSNGCSTSTGSGGVTPGTYITNTRLVSIRGATFTVPSDKITANVPYKVMLFLGDDKSKTYPDPPVTFGKKISTPDTITASINPTNFPNPESTRFGKGKIMVKIENGTDEEYKICVVGKGDSFCKNIRCLPSPTDRSCVLEYTIPNQGLDPATSPGYTLSIEVPGTTRIANKEFTVNSSQGSPRSGGSPIICTNGVDSSGKPCTSSGGIRCNTSDGKRDDTSGDGILTAIGCVPTEPQKLIQGLFRVGVGLGGAAALLLMIGGAFQFITSAGNPDAIKSATETFTQAIIGLLVIIFAVLLLQVIGVDILNIPGFSK